MNDRLDFVLTVIKRDYKTNDRLKFILSFIRRDNGLNDRLKLVKNGRKETESERNKDESQKTRNELKVSDLEEEVYMTQPHGFAGSDKSVVCKLKKAIYGLKQTPRAWYERLTKTLLTFGFVQSKCDPSLLVFKTVSDCLYLLIYVDDIIITGSSSVLIQKLITKLHAVFALKQLGNLEFSGY